MKSKWSYQTKSELKITHVIDSYNVGEIIYKGLLYSSISNLCESV